MMGSVIKLGNDEPVDNLPIIRLRKKVKISRR
jgi:hypothetical protein